LLELFRNIDRPECWNQIKGIAFREGQDVVVTAARPLIKDLDLLPFPNRSHSPGSHRGLGIRSVAGSRGCYYECSFCSIQGFYQEPPGPKRRARTPANFVREIETLFYDYNARIFVFQDDDVFTKGQHHRQWLEDFITEIKRSGLADKILWRISCRIDDLNRNLLLKMKAIGLVSVYLGIESGSEQGLETFKKHYHVQDIYRALNILKEIDMPFEYGFMLLEPGSTFESVRENIDFLKEIGRDGRSLVNFCKMAPYAGTSIARDLEAEGRIEGTLASPDYRFLDPRMDLFQLFVSRTFNFRNFSEHGLVERLRFIKFDCAVLEKFYPGQYDVSSYKSAVRDLIRQCNETALETLSMAARLMENVSENKVFDYWPILQQLELEEKSAELRIGATLDRLMAAHDFESQVHPWNQLERQVLQF
jgi:hypothetical protein